MDNKSKTKSSNDKLDKNIIQDQKTILEQNNEDSMTLEQENQFKEKIAQLQKELEIENPENVCVYTVLTIPKERDYRDMTANLLAPIVINTDNMSAKQIVMDGSHYNTKHRLFPEKKG